MSFKFDGSLLTSDRTLAGGQVLGDMGLVDGSLTVREEGIGAARINSNAIELLGTTAGWDDAQIYYPTSITFADGQIISLHVDRQVGASGAAAAAQFVAAVPHTTNTTGWLFGLYMIGDIMYFVEGVTGFAQQTVTLGTGEYIHFVTDTTNDLLFVYVGDASSATLKGIKSGFSLVSAYLACMSIDATYYAYYKHFKIPDTLQPDLVAWDGHDTFTEVSDTTLDLHTPEIGTWVGGGSTALSDVDIIAASDIARGTSTSCSPIMDVGSKKQYVKAVGSSGSANEQLYVWLRGGTDLTTNNAVLYNTTNSSGNWQVREWVGGSLFTRATVTNTAGNSPCTFEGYIDDTTLRIILSGSQQTNVTVGSDATGYDNSTYAGIETNAIYEDATEFACKKLDGHTITV